MSNVDIDSGDLLFQTYYMMDWQKVRQEDSGSTCVTCGRKMKKVDPMRDKMGRIYDGFVCHGCKSVFWVKRD